MDQPSSENLSVTTSVVLNQESHDVTEIISAHREEILAITAKFGALNVRLFGSTARRDSDEDSDIDLLVDLQSGRTLLDLGGLVEELSERLKCPVDVVTERGLRDRIRSRVLEEAKPL